MQTSKLKKLLQLITKTVSIGAVLCTLATPAYAEILLGITKTSPTIYGGASYSVDWNGGAAGGVLHYFQTSEPNTRVVLSFNAECAVMMAGSQKWVGIDIVVNPAGPTGNTVAGPSNGDNALCSGNSTADSIYGHGDGWVSAMTQATIILPQAGTHSVKVRVNGQASGTARLDDMSLIVQR